MAGSAVEYLWELSRQRQTDTLSQEVERNFYERCPPELRPVTLRPASNTEDFDEKVSSTDLDKDAQPNEHNAAAQHSHDEKHAPKKKYDASLTKALHKTFFWRIWIAGVLKLMSGPYTSS
ncbi:hypothetical protein EIP86_003743 [Pleurotus ostreatoroseus]|nr:hypothetical protein EIP86_003743 [Pleurotus ostreatoroseus]